MTKAEWAIAMLEEAVLEVLRAFPDRRGQNSDTIAMKAGLPDSGDIVVGVLRQLQAKGQVVGAGGWRLA